MENVLDNTMVQTITQLYRTFGISIKPVSVIQGPATTLIEVQPIGQTKVAAVVGLEEELTVALAAKSVRIGVLPGRGTIGIEIATGKQSMVPFEFDAIAAKGLELPISMGKDVTGQPIYKDLTKMVQLLVGGSTGQGKSVFINTLVTSLLQSGQNLQFVMIDPKQVELAVYQGLHSKWFFPDKDQQTGPITDGVAAFEMLQHLCAEMDARYKAMQHHKVRNMVEARAKGLELPYIVCVIDEFADLIITNKAIEQPVVRLAQLGRASGIHIVLATQRPSAAVVTGLIKANFPTRIAFRTASNMDSRVILDKSGAEKLLGAGDMLYSSGIDLLRIQGAFISMAAVEELVQQYGHPINFSTSVTAPPIINTAPAVPVKAPVNIFADEQLQLAAQIVVTNGRGSTALLQRKMKLGYDRANQLVQLLEQAGILGPLVDDSYREVLNKAA